MNMNKEELAREVENMTEDELNDFAFFSLKVLDKRCDLYEAMIYLMAEHIKYIQSDENSVKDIINSFISRVVNEDVEFDRTVLFSEIINK